MSSLAKVSGGLVRVCFHVGRLGSGLEWSLILEDRNTDSFRGLLLFNFLLLKGG